MKPIFKEEIDLLKKHFNINIPTHSWNDKGWVFQFNNKYEKIILGRLITKFNGVITFKKSKRAELINPLTHIEYLSHTSNYKEKIIESTNMLKAVIKKYSNYSIELMNSTGKDSVCAEFVLDKVRSDYINIFTNTSLDVAPTLLQAKKLNNLKIISPPIGFYNWIQEDKQIVPTRGVRKCCDIFKEGLIAKNRNDDDEILYMTGLRASESTGRSQYTFEMINTKWNKVQQQNWRMINPIIEWDEIDIWACILLNDLSINPLYKLGYKRVGCGIACPMQSTYVMALDKIIFPNQYKRYRKILKNKFIYQNGWNIYNCTAKEYCWDGWKNGTRYRKEITQEVIKDFMKYKGIDNMDVAKKYFDMNCKNKCIAKKSRLKRPKRLRAEEIALNLKLIGRNINSEDMLCKECLSKYLNCSIDQLNDMVKDFKNQGCKLF